MSKVIIFRKQDGGVAVIYPGENFLSSLINGGFTESDAMDYIASLDVQVETTEDGIINGGVVPMGSYIRRHDAVSNSIAFTETPYEIVDKASIPERKNREKIWRWS